MWRRHLCGMRWFAAGWSCATVCLGLACLSVLPALKSYGITLQIYVILWIFFPFLSIKHWFFASFKVFCFIWECNCPCLQLLAVVPCPACFSCQEAWWGLPRYGLLLLFLRGHCVFISRFRLETYGTASNVLRYPVSGFAWCVFHFFRFKRCCGTPVEGVMRTRMGGVCKMLKARFLPVL